jgi:hypothetical protein
MTDKNGPRKYNGRMFVCVCVCVCVCHIKSVRQLTATEYVHSQKIVFATDPDDRESHVA